MQVRGLRMLASKAAAMGSGTPWGTLSLARQCQHRNTGGGGTQNQRHEAEQCAGLAEGFEEECEWEHLDRRGAGASLQQCASATRVLAGISSVNCGREYYMCTIGEVRL